MQRQSASPPERKQDGTAHDRRGSAWRSWQGSDAPCCWRRPWLLAAAPHGRTRRGRRGRQGHLHVSGLGRLRAGPPRQRARLLQGGGHRGRGDPRRRHAERRSPPWSAATSTATCAPSASIRASAAARRRRAPSSARSTCRPAATAGRPISAIKSVCDLKGKTIAVEPNLPARLIMQMALKKECNLSIKDTNLADIAAADAIGVFADPERRGGRHLRAGAQPGGRRPCRPRRPHPGLVQGLRGPDPRRDLRPHRRARRPTRRNTSSSCAPSIARSTTSTPTRKRRSRSSRSTSRSRRTTSRRRCRTSATRPSPRRSS